MGKKNTNKLEKLKDKLEAQEKENKNIPYWKLEEPVIIEQGNMEIHHYKESGALQIKIKSTNENDKTYVSQGINLRKYKLLKQPEMLSCLAEIFTNWQQEAIEE